MGTGAFSAAGPSKPLTNTEDQGRLVHIGEKIVACPQARWVLFPQQRHQARPGREPRAAGMCDPWRGVAAGSTHMHNTPPEGAPRLASLRLADSKPAPHVAGKERVGSISPACTRCCVTFMHVSAVTSKWLRARVTVGAPDGRQSRKRSQTNRSHVPNVRENPMGRQLPRRSHENIWEEGAHARP